MGEVIEFPIVRRVTSPAEPLPSLEEFSAQYRREWHEKYGALFDAGLLGPETPLPTDEYLRDYYALSCRYRHLARAAPRNCDHSEQSK